MNKLPREILELIILSVEPNTQYVLKFVNNLCFNIIREKGVSSNNGLIIVSVKSGTRELINFSLWDSERKVYNLFTCTHTQTKIN